MKLFSFSPRQLFKQIGIAFTCSLLISSASFSEESSVTAASVDAAIPAKDTSVPVEPALQSAPSSGRRLWNLQDADILSVINEVSQETGKNFVVDPRVSGKITLVSSKPLKQNEVYQVFLSVLGILGYSAVPSGNIIKIVPNMESGEQATPVATNQLTGRGDEVVVRVIPLENVSASQLIPVLRPMLPQWSNISAYTPGNVIILLGRASNLDRIHTIIEDIDKASTSGIQLIPLRHASAPQVATVLNNLQAAARASGEASSVSIAVDERSNSILLGGPKAARLRVRVLLSQLDAPSQAPAGNTEVIYLRYLEAKTLAPLLSKIAANIMGKGAGAQYEATTSATTATSSTTTSSASAASNSTNIQAETSTNAVIITAQPTLMQALKAVIAKLDIRPAQVLVEAIIAEIDEGDVASLGIQWGGLVTKDTIQPPGNTLTTFPNFGAGVVGIIPSMQIQAILSLLRNQSGVDILSTPTIMVLDNQKATIEVGQDVPVQTGSYATTGNATTATPFNTTGYKPVTLKLDVTPQINLGSSVRLKLALKKDTLQNPQNPGNTPIIDTNKISNSVIVKTEDVLVIGGLMSNANNEIINKVPILGDVPIIGKIFFQQRANSQQKRNLMVFIKPIILHNEEQSMMISESKYDYIRNKQQNFREDLATVGDHSDDPKLPPWKNKKDLPMPFENRCPPGSVACRVD